MEPKDLIKELEKLLGKREAQLNKEVYQSYNYGYVAGEISGINKAIEKIKEHNK